MGLYVDTFPVGPLAMNASVVADRVAGVAMLIDPGDEPERLFAAVEASGARLTAFLLTHAHFDHMGALAACRRRRPDVPIYMHPREQPVYDAAPLMGRFYGKDAEAGPPVDHALAEGDGIRVGTFVLNVIETPGHTPGGVSFYVDDGETKRVFCGDALFKGSIGRTDFPGGDAETLLHSVRAKLLALPPETVVIPGHGELTTVGWERATNPFA